MRSGWNLRDAVPWVIGSGRGRRGGARCWAAAHPSGAAASSPRALSLLGPSLSSGSSSRAQEAAQRPQAGLQSGALGWAAGGAARLQLATHRSRGLGADFRARDEERPRARGRPPESVRGRMGGCARGHSDHPCGGASDESPSRGPSSLHAHCGVPVWLQSSWHSTSSRSSGFGPLTSSFSSRPSIHACGAKGDAVDGPGLGARATGVPCAGPVREQPPC